MLRYGEFAMHNATHVVIPKLCSLYKQPRSTRWYARIKMDDGTWYRVATNELELEAAKSRALELYYEATIKGKNNLPQNTRSFSSIAKSIVKKLESTRETMQWKQTYQAYIYAINKYQIPYFGHCKLDNLRDKYEGYVDYVAKEIGRTPAQSTLSNHHAALKIILDEAVARGWANTSTLPIIKNIGKQSSRRATFEIDEYRSLIVKLRHWCKKPTHRKKDAEIKLLLYDYVLILANSGIRHGREAMEITWRNISFEKSKKGNDIVTINVIKRKGRKATEERRTVVVRHNAFSDVKKVLTRLKDRNPKFDGKTLEAIIKQRIDEPLFVLVDGTQPKRMDGTFKKFLSSSELLVGAENKDRTLYSFRHFYASQQLLRKIPITIYLLAKQMGTSVKMIEQHYGHMETFQKADELSDWRDID